MFRRRLARGRPTWARGEQMGVLVLLPLILGVLAGYAHLAVGAARDVRQTHALRQTAAVADLSARLLDADPADALAPVRAAASGAEAATFVVGADGRPVGRSAADRALSAYVPFRRALSGPPGAMVAPRPDTGEQAVVGYAFAPRHGQVVLVAAPLAVEQASTDLLVDLLALLGVPVLALLLPSLWILAGMYQRQRAMTRQLAERNHRLLEVDRAKSEFLATVSHDLRTPLAAMQLSISGLLDPEFRWDLAPGRETLRVAAGQIDQLAARVRNLLEAARWDAAPPAIKPELCDLTDVVGSALDRLRPLLAGRAVDARFPDEPMLVECDQVQMETAIVNLLENAAKYAPAGTPINLSGCREGEWLVVAVRDHGPGIVPGDEERVFDKFHSARAGKTAGGAGLGLAICRAVVEAHGGCISAANAPGGGAVFRFRLPAPALGQIALAPDDAPALKEVA